MGFQDLDRFNSALLAKQLWRLHMVPDSLLARTLKSKYYPHASIWGSKLGYNPSFSWRNMWSARFILEKGTRWRIGDGRTVQIWKDAWLGREGSGKIISPSSLLAPYVTVSDLIDPDHKNWKLGLLGSIFQSMDVDRILQVPLMNLVWEERLCFQGQGSV